MKPVPPSHSDELKVGFPIDNVMLLTLNRPAALNTMTPRLEADLKSLLDWFDDVPELWVAVITGEGRAFCAGADLKAWQEGMQSGKRDDTARLVLSPHGFGAVSRRGGATAPRSCKPLVAAVNGIGAYGGGVELLLGCDIVIASEDARFALPEVKRGVVAAQGGIPRLARVAGHHMAAEFVLLGRTVSAVDARDKFRFVNAVVSAGDVLRTALAWAAEIARNSPDAVQSSKRALMHVADAPGVEDAFLRHVLGEESKRVYDGENIQEGINAFSEKRPPNWKAPAKL